MTRLLRVLPEAEAELQASAQWYESKRAGLGAEFIASVDEALDLILEAPLTSPIWREGSPWRRHVLRPAIAHALRRPGYWLARK